MKAPVFHDAPPHAPDVDPPQAGAPRSVVMAEYLNGERGSNHVQHQMPNPVYCEVTRASACGYGSAQGISVYCLSQKPSPLRPGREMYSLGVIRGKLELFEFIDGEALPPEGGQATK
jgi:hypothetical protein